MMGIPNDEAVERYTDHDEPSRIVILNPRGRKPVTVTAWCGKRRLERVEVKSLRELRDAMVAFGKTCGLQEASWWQRLSQWWAK